MKAYVDGSSLGIEGPGGWAVLFVEDDSDLEGFLVSGSENHTTNNRMELTAIQRALFLWWEEMPEKELEIVSDSQYAIGVSTGEKKSHTNEDLVEEIQNRLVGTEGRVSFRWIPGHFFKLHDIVDSEARKRCLEIAKAKP